MRVPETIHTRLHGDRSGRRPVRRWIGHGFQVTAAIRPNSATVELCGCWRPPVRSSRCSVSSR
ncbi:hypothetical protein FKW78_11435 [Mycolicibacterium fortuitum]|nr:hypothetical protein FKW78_11435 [Mycolicibacterium fortuitum]